MLYHRIVYRPLTEVIPPSAPTGIFVFPSARFYYLDINQNAVAAPSDDQLSLKIWYSMKADEIFPVETSYLKAREDQIGILGSEKPYSDLSLSLKNRLRQYPDSSDGIYDDRFQILLGVMKLGSIDTFISDFMRFPPSPSSDIFESGRLLDQYIRDGDEKPIRKYFSDRGIHHLKNHDFGYYPVYYLFFLMTRFATYPFSENQLLLAIRRAKTAFDSPERIFLDALFDYQIPQIDLVLGLIDQIANEGALEVGRRFGTRHADWVVWGDEYFKNLAEIPESIESLKMTVGPLSQKLLTWKDDQIEELCERLGIELPIRNEYPSRISYIESLAGTISSQPSQQ